MTREGIRLRHPTLRSGVYIVQLRDRPYVKGGVPLPVLCHQCIEAQAEETSHVYKSIHLALDAQGGIVVSRGVYDDLLTVKLGGMELVGMIYDPPTVLVSADVRPLSVVRHLLTGS